MPKRIVNIHFEDLSVVLREKSVEDKQRFNELLENYYNQKGEENATFIIV